MTEGATFFRCARGDRGLGLGYGRKATGHLVEALNQSLMEVGLVISADPDLVSQTDLDLTVIGVSRAFSTEIDMVFGRRLISRTGKPSLDTFSYCMSPEILYSIKNDVLPLCR
jgi:hypothetical protein